MTAWMNSTPRRGIGASENQKVSAPPTTSQAPSTLRWQRATWGFWSRGIKNNSLMLAWVVALIATVGSLYAGEVLRLEPCKLCWYQRIAMYPLVIILLQGVFKPRQDLWQLAAPFFSLGIVIATYHYLLQRGLAAGALAPCSVTISCATDYFNWFGFITIPLMSLISFIFIAMMVYVNHRHTKQSGN